MFKNILKRFKKNQEDIENIKHEQNTVHEENNEFFRAISQLIPLYNNFKRSLRIKEKIFEKQKHNWEKLNQAYDFEKHTYKIGNFDFEEWGKEYIYLVKKELHIYDLYIKGVNETEKILNNVNENYKQIIQKKNQETLKDVKTHDINFIKATTIAKHLENSVNVFQMVKENLKIVEERLKLEEKIVEKLETKNVFQKELKEALELFKKEEDKYLQIMSTLQHRAIWMDEHTKILISNINKEIIEIEREMHYKVNKLTKKDIEEWEEFKRKWKENMGKYTGITAGQISLPLIFMSAFGVISVGWAIGAVALAITGGYVWANN